MGNFLIHESQIRADALPNGHPSPFHNLHPPPPQVSWSQSEDEVEVTIDLPEGVKARDVSVTIKYNLIKFDLKNGHSMDDEGLGPSKTLLERLSAGVKLYDNIDPELSTWTLSDGVLVITLTKRESFTWNYLDDRSQ